MPSLEKVDLYVLESYNEFLTLIMIHKHLSAS